MQTSLNISKNFYCQTGNIHILNICKIMIIHKKWTHVDFSCFTVLSYNNHTQSTTLEFNRKDWKPSLRRIIGLHGGVGLGVRTGSISFKFRSNSESSSILECLAEEKSEEKRSRKIQARKVNVTCRLSILISVTRRNSDYFEENPK